MDFFGIYIYIYIYTKKLTEHLDSWQKIANSLEPVEKSAIAIDDNRKLFALGKKSWLTGAGSRS